MTTPYLRLAFREGKNGRREIVAAVRRELEAGNLPVGFRLPPIRAISHQLGVSKTTVADAYEELAAAGLVESRARRGYFVAPRFTRIDDALRMTAPAPRLFEGKLPPVFPTRKKDRRLELGSVFIDERLLPREKLAECFRSALRSPGLRPSYDQQGYEPLRIKIAERLVKRGIPAHSNDVIVTSGSQQALDIVARSLKDRTIATENPAYGIGKLLFEMSGMRTLGLPLDPFKGIDLAEWRRRLEHFRPAALYLTTNFHNPTGYSYSTTELMGILELARDFDFGLVEDDWGSDMLSFSEFRPALRALGGENVLYLNSFTKKLLPSLRVGYVLAGPTTRETLLAAKRVASLASPTIIEAALFEFLDRGYYDRHLSDLQRALDARYRHCLDLLARLMPDDVRWTRPGGGPILWLELPRRISIPDLDRGLAASDISLDSRTSDWFFGTPHLHGIKIGYARLAPDELEIALTVLASRLKETQGAARRSRSDRSLQSLV